MAIPISLFFGNIFSQDSKYKKIQAVTFISEDTLAITGDVYISNPLTVPFIILFHKEGWGRREYLGIASRLNEMGFNCIKIDHRSGNKINNIINQTHRR